MCSVCATGTAVAAPAPSSVTTVANARKPLRRRSTPATTIDTPSATAATNSPRAGPRASRWAMAVAVPAITAMPSATPTNASGVRGELRRRSLRRSAASAANAVARSCRSRRACSRTARSTSCCCRRQASSCIFHAACCSRHAAYASSSGAGRVDAAVPASVEESAAVAGRGGQGRMPRSRRHPSPAGPRGRPDPNRSPRRTHPATHPQRKPSAAGVPEARSARSDARRAR